MVLLKRVSLVFAALIVAAGIGWILILTSSAVAFTFCTSFAISFN